MTQKRKGIDGKGATQRRFLLVLLVALLIPAFAACRNGGGEEGPGLQDVIPTPVIAAGVPPQPQVTPPAGASELAPGDYGVAERDGRFVQTYKAMDVTCLADNLLSLETDKDTFFVVVFVATNYNCEHLRRNLLRTIGVGETEEMRGLAVGLRYRKLDTPSPVGGFQLTVLINGSSLTLTTSGVWHTGR